MYWNVPSDAWKSVILNSSNVSAAAVVFILFAFGDEDNYQENDQDGGKGTVYHTTGAFWYNETDQYGDLQ